MVTKVTAWRLTGWICAGVIIISVLLCILIATQRSVGLVAVTVTVLDPDEETSDLNVPLMKRREALPDYELSLLDLNGWTRYLGVKPDESAAAGLTWQLDDPVSISQISTVRLQEKDVLLSDAIAEVQILGPSIESNGYRFEFKTERSIAAGLQGFFATPIGIAIAGGFSIAVFVIIIGHSGFYG